MSSNSLSPQASTTPLLPSPSAGPQSTGSAPDRNSPAPQASSPNMTDSRDFTDAPKEPPTVTFDLGGDMENGLFQTSSPEHLRPPLPPRAHSAFSESGISIHNPAPESLDPEYHAQHPDDPILRNRKSRSNTMWQTFPSVIDNPRRVGWEPGQEPGLDPEKWDGGRPRGMSDLHQECDITVVEYSESNMVMRRLTNQNLHRWIAREEMRDKMRKQREEEEANEKLGKSRKAKRKMGHDNDENNLDWAKCRWINVNGLSWDVIQAIAKYKKLHKLALEDLVNTKNRTKADWYTDQTYIILTLQKLVKIPPEDGDSESDYDSDNEDDSLNILKRGLGNGTSMQLIDKLFGRGHSPSSAAAPSVEATQHAESLESNLSAAKGRVPIFPQPRTLQRYNGGVNLDRTIYMEEHSALTEKHFAVCAEQVSIFLLNDNTVISFFESSGEEIERPILRRLATAETILRRSGDSSMLAQAIIDAIIDMAIPVAEKYSEIIQELELEVLTEPSITHTKQLYILTSEVTTMRNFIAPIATLVRTMRDHKGQALARINREIQNSGGAHPTHATVEISPMAAMYLADVEDHTVSILADLEQISQSAAGLISLIFNTISAFQNESMKQLTTATIIFLPMTFITGYFGMNFEKLSGITPGEGQWTGTDKYFWVIAAPVAFVTLVALMWGGIWRWIHKWFEKLTRKRQRKNRQRLFGNRLGRKTKKTMTETQLMNEANRKKQKSLQDLHNSLELRRTEKHKRQDTRSLRSLVIEAGGRRWRNPAPGRSSPGRSSPNGDQAHSSLHGSTAERSSLERSPELTT